MDILNLFINFPGDMLFFLLVIACSQVSLFLAYGHRSRFPLEQSTLRYVMATGALTLVWLVMLGAAVVALYGGLDANLIMPPLERLVHALTLLLLGWAFLSADFFHWRNRSNLIIFGVAFLLTLLFINTARGWLADHEAGLLFNGTDYALIWTAATGCIAAAALLLTALNTRHIVDAPLKALFFFLFVAGSCWDLLQFAQGEISGHYQGAARLAQAAGLVLLPLIIHRLAVALLENSLVEVMLAASQRSEALPADAQPSMDSTPRDGISRSPTQRDSSRLLDAISAMLDADSADSASMRVVKAASTALSADICALLRLPNDNTAHVIAGWDKASEKPIADAALDLSRQPTLLSAAKRSVTTTLLPDHHTDELRHFFARLGIDGLGSLVAQPMQAGGELVGILVVGSPYQHTDFEDADIALLAEIATVAGQLLAGQSDDNDQSPPSSPSGNGDVSQADEAESPPADTVMNARRELTASFRGAAERIERLDMQIGGLEQQLGDEQTRLLEHLAQTDDGAIARETALAALCELSRLLEDCDASARDLLDAEAALRLLNGEDALDSSAQEFLHKRYNLLLNTRDRLRRQISALAVLRRSTSADALAGLLQQSRDESAQLSLQRDQLLRRRGAISSRLTQLGADDLGAAMLPALAQIHAERQAWRQLIADKNRQQKSLQDEHRSLLEAGAGDRMELESQLKQMTADHESLLESRESLRREQQEMRRELDESAVRNDTLAVDMRKLESELDDEKARQESLRRQVDDLADERDNLLAIRDQLTAKVAEALEDESRHDADRDLRQELEAMRKMVARLSQQREDLALDLSDARLEMAQSPLVGQPDAGSRALLGTLLDLRAPIDSLRAHVDLLLAESLGILGAAQLKVLRLASTEVAAIAETLSELRRAASAFAHSGDEQTAFDVAGVIDEAIGEAGERFAGKRLLIELSLEDDLPPVAIDCAGLKHLLAQLMMNACEASPAGAQVHVSAHAGSAMLPSASDAIDALAFRVRDAGGGIASADLPRVFSRTYRSAYPNIEGMGDNGVGISVARAIARAHKGDIWVTTETGQGATFHLALPLQPNALEA